MAKSGNINESVQETRSYLFVGMNKPKHLSTKQLDYDICFFGCYMQIMILKPHAKQNANIKNLLQLASALQST